MENIFLSSSYTKSCEGAKKRQLCGRHPTCGNLGTNLAFLLIHESEENEIINFVNVIQPSQVCNFMQHFAWLHNATTPTAT